MDGPRGGNSTSGARYTGLMMVGCDSLPQWDGFRTVPPTPLPLPMFSQLHIMAHTSPSTHHASPPSQAQTLVILTIIDGWLAK